MRRQANWSSWHNVQHAKSDKKITKHSKRISGVPMSRVAVNQQSMEVHNWWLGIWKRITKCRETVVQQLEGYVHLIEKENSPNKKDGGNNLKSVKSNQGFVRNVKEM
jgi:hypothetical protein